MKFWIRYLLILSLVLTPFQLAERFLPEAIAAGTSVSGSIDGLPNSAWAVVWAEGKAGDNWKLIEKSQSKISSPFTYNLTVDSLIGKEVRINALAYADNKTYLMLGNSFVSSTSPVVQNFSLPPININFRVLPVNACANASIYIGPGSGSDWDYGLGLNLNESATAQMALPSGKKYFYEAFCSGDLGQKSNSLTVPSSLETVTVNLGTENLTGQISNITSRNDAEVWVQEKESNPDFGFDFWRSIYSISIKNDGSFGTRLPKGTYRLVVVPAAESKMSSFAMTIGDEFSIGDTAAVTNVSLKTTANVTYTVTPKSIAVGSEVQIMQKVTFTKGEKYFYLLNTKVNADGKIRVNLPVGKYQFNVYPNSKDYAKTSASEINISSSSTTVDETLALETPNLTVNMSSLVPESDLSGWISGESSDGTLDFSGGIIDGVAKIKAAAGTYNLRIIPNTQSESQTATYIDGVSISGGTQTLNYQYASANFRGTLSPLPQAAEAWLTLQQKRSTVKGDFWVNFTNVSTDLNGKFFGNLPNGIYRAKANCNSQCISTNSAQFTINSNSITLDFSFASPNIQGTVSPTTNSAGGSIEARLQPGTNWNSDYTENYYGTIKSDGTYQLLLPPGDYKLRAWPGCLTNPCSTDYVFTSSTLFTVSDTTTPITKDFSLKAPNLLGAITPVEKVRDGYSYVEKYSDGVWQYLDEPLELKADGTFAIYLDPGFYRLVVNPRSDAVGVGVLTTDSITVTNTPQTLNLVLPSSNFEASFLPLGADFRGKVLLESIEGSTFKGGKSLWLNPRSDGKVESFLTAGKYRLSIWPQSQDYSQTFTEIFEMPATATLQSFSFTLNATNLKGKISPVEASRYANVCVESNKEGVWTGRYEYCDSADYEGKYKFKVADGTYRLIITPNVWYSKEDNFASKYTITTSESFTISGDIKVLDYTLSTGNLTGTVSPTSASTGGVVMAIDVSGSYKRWTPYRAMIDSNGKYALQLPEGKYVLLVEPSYSSKGYLRTESQAINVGNSNVIENITLDTPNVSGTVSPVDKSAGGWVYAEQYTCRCGWTGWAPAPGVATNSPIYSDGTYELKVQEGVTRIVAFPNWTASGVVKTYSDSFTATLTPQTVNFTLSSGNVSGTVTPTTNSQWGWIEIQQYNQWGWSSGGSTSIKPDGTFTFDVPTGTYRLIASPGWNPGGLATTVIDTFTATTGVPITKNVTLQLANVTGNVTNLEAATSLSTFSRYGVTSKANIDAAWATVVRLDSSGNWIWEGRTFGIRGDGNYSLHLLPGTYKFYVHNLPEFVSGLTGGYTDSFTVVTGSSKIFDFALQGTNLRGQILPANNSNWGWVCAQQKVVGTDYWKAQWCTNIKGDGSYELIVPAGDYRLEANPYWGSSGYARTYSDTVTVSSSGIVTKNLTLDATNVRLTVLDFEGRPNYDGWVEVRDSSGNWVDTRKSGWISELGKVDFKLQPDTYTVNIQPGRNAAGVRTTLTIIVPTTGILTSTLNLVDGNIQGTARKSGGSALVCGFVTATAAGKTPVKTLTKSNGAFTLNLETGIVWTLTVTDPSNGNSKTETLTPVGSANAITITVT